MIDRVILVCSFTLQFGEVLERDKTACKATIQLLSDRNSVVRLDYDIICEYLGDISTDYDY